MKGLLDDWLMCFDFRALRKKRVSLRCCDFSRFLLEEILP